MSGQGKVFKDIFGKVFDPDERVHVQELAARIHKSDWYVYGMRIDGFFMPFGMASFNDAVEWYRSNPNFSAKRAHASAKKRASS